MEDKSRNYIKSLEETFKARSNEICDTDFYRYDGRRQSIRKTEFINSAKRIAKDRGIPSYDPDHLVDEMKIGVPLGQRYLEPVKISSTNVICEVDDEHVLNNVAMQQMYDDIFRTAIFCLDLPHRILVERLAEEITPESINLYLETINHTMVGGAIIQEHMAEVNPNLCADGYVKVFSGDDEQADEIDKRFLIDINIEFSKNKADKLKDEIGRSLWQVSRIPTHGLRSMDGSVVHRWNAMAQSLALIATYRTCAGESTISDFAFSAKHAKYVWIGTSMFDSRARGHNQPGGMPCGYIFDIIQYDSEMPDDPVPVSMEGAALASILYTQWYYGQMMIGSVGATVGPSSNYNDDVNDSFGYYVSEWIKEKYGGFCKAEMSWDTIHECAKAATMYCLEEYERFPLLQEHHWGLIKAAFTAGVADFCAAWATGNSMAGALAAHYSACLLQKEAILRTGWAGFETQHHNAMAMAGSILPDEGMPTELQGANVPFRSYLADGPYYTSLGSVAAHEARMDAWALSPVVKVAFADRNLPFNFRNIRDTIAKGAIHEFKAAGERDSIMP